MTAATLLAAAGAATVAALGDLHVALIIAVGGAVVGLSLASITAWYLVLVALLPVANVRPPGSPVGLATLVAAALAVRLLVERDLREVLRWPVPQMLVLPVLLITPALLASATPLAKRMELPLAMLMFMVIAVASAELLTPRTWVLVKRVLFAQLGFALAVGYLEIRYGRWLLPLPDPIGVETEFFDDGMLRPRAFFLSPYGLSIFLAFTAPVVWSSFIRAWTRRDLFGAAGWAAMSAAQLGLLAATLSRKGWFQLGVSLAVFILVLRRDAVLRHGRAVVLVLVAVLGIATIASQQDAIASRLTARTSEKSVEFRELTIRDAIDVGRGSPVLGAGLGAFELSTPARYGEQHRVYSSFAEQFADAGVPGLLAVLTGLLFPLIFGLRGPRVSTPEKAVACAILAGLVGLAIGEASAWSEYTALAAGLCLAAGLATGAGEGSTAHIPSVREPTVPS